MDPGWAHHLVFPHTTAWRRASIVRRLRGLSEVRRAYLEGTIGIEAADVIRRALGGPADIASSRSGSPAPHLDAQATLRRGADCVETTSPRGTAGDSREPCRWHRSLRRIPGRGLAAVIGAGCRVLDAVTASSSNPDVFLRLGLPPEHRPWTSKLRSNSKGAPWRSRPSISTKLRCNSRARARHSLRIASALREKFAGVPAWVGLLALLEEYVFTWDVSPHRAGEATYERAGYRCEAPGCTSRRNLEMHHIVYRSRGGRSTSDNLVCLCRMHHQQGEHGGQARCRGRAPLGVVWRLGVPNLATWFRNEMRLMPAG